MLGIYDTIKSRIEWFAAHYRTAVLEDDPSNGAYVAGISAAKLLYLHVDHLGAPRRLTKPADNSIAWRWEPDAFGNGNATGEVEYSMRLPGQIYDLEHNITENWHREYDPYTGRYMQSDPIGLQGGLNTFGYADQNPIRNVDPFGLSEADVDAVLDHLRSNFPEIRPRVGWDFQEPGEGASADTSPFSGRMHFGSKYSAECLSLDDFTELYANVLHESMHGTDDIFTRLIDSAHGRSGTLNHSAIENRENYEMDRLPQWGSKYPMYRWPMWNIPYDPNFNRKPVAEKIPLLYESTRTEKCRCAN